MIGATGAAAGDALMLGHSVSGREFRLRWFENLLCVPPVRMALGHLLGILAIPFMGFGIWQMYLGLEPAGLPYALPPALAMGYSLVIGAAVHGSFAPLGAAMQLRSRVDERSAAEIDHVARWQRKLVYVVFGTFLVLQLISWGWFAFVVLSRPTFFPAWIVFANPIVAQAAVMVIAEFLPAPAGGYLGAAAQTSANVVYFLAATVALA